MNTSCGTENVDVDVDSGLQHELSLRLNNMGKGLDRVICPVSRYASVAGSIFILAMAVLIVVDVLSRYVFNRPFMITIELEQFMLATAVYLSIAWAMINNDHVQVDIFISRFNKKTRLRFELIFTLLALFVFIVMGWQLFIMAKEAFQVGDAGDLTGIPIGLVVAVMIIGSLMMILVLMRNLLRQVAEHMLVSSRPLMVTACLFLIGLLIMVSAWFCSKAGVQFSPPVVGLIAILAMLLLMFTGLPIAFSMALTGILGTWMIMSADVSFAVVRMQAFESVSDYFLCVVPFFVLMGTLAFNAGLSKSAYDAAYSWFGHMPGGVAVATVAGCSGFAAICGDSMATAATMGSVSLPEMRKYRYSDSLATGALAAGGTLGILIPPSIGFIVYGLIAEVSVAKLFMAGVLPGLLMAGLFVLIILGRCSRNPALGPACEKMPFMKRVKALGGIWSVLVLFIIVIGGIYLGIFTPTEAGAAGVIGAFVIGVIKPNGLSWQGFLKSLEEAMRMTAMIFMILIGVSFLGYFMTSTEIPLALSNMIASAEVSRYVILISILLLYVLLGMVMNIIPMIMLTLPIIFPTVMALGFDPIWFGVITVIMMEMGQITPPVGINVFVIHGVAKNVPMGSIFRGVVPFLMVQIVVVVVLILFPKIATYLPSLMKTLASLGG
ncbi:MAG: TRAP transporter large permease subunit [Thermodesulfobacteriota bacterium]